MVAQPLRAGCDIGRVCRLRTHAREADELLELAYEPRAIVAGVGQGPSIDAHRFARVERRSNALCLELLMPDHNRRQSEEASPTASG